MKPLGSEELITIVVPVYNVDKYVSKCIESLLHQTYSNLEIIIVDDGSTDKSGEICDSYAKSDNRIKVIHQTNKGQSASRNKALSVANGNYIAFVDSDDYVSPLFIEKLYKRMSQDNSDISMCGYHAVDEKGMVLDTKLLDNGILNKSQFIDIEVKGQTMICVALWNKLFKREIWKGLKLKEGVFAEDSFVLNEYLQKINSISTVDQPLYNYVQRSNSLVHSYSLKNLDTVDALLKRLNYYVSIGERHAAEVCLFRAATKLNEGYNKLDLTKEPEYSRYCRLKKKFDYNYTKIFDPFRLSKEYFFCTLFFISERLFNFIINIKFWKKRRY